MSIHDLDHTHKSQAGGGTDEGAGSGADATPVEHVALDGCDIVSCSRMPYLIYIEPFVIVVKVMEFTVREFFVPEIVEADGDDGADSGFDDDGAGDATGIVMFGWFEEFLGTTIAPDTAEQNAHDDDASDNFKGFGP